MAGPESSGLHDRLLSSGIEAPVAAELVNIHKLGLLAENDLDDRAVDAIKEFSADRALAVLAEFKNSDLTHVTNKSAFLCGIMKMHRQRVKGAGPGESPQGPGRRPGPDEAAIKAILDRTGYSLDVTTGQRKYGGPPPNWTGSTPGAGHEVFCGRIPKEVFEDELIPLFEKCGHIWDLRLMMDPMSGYNRSFCFVTFSEREGAADAVRRLNGHEIRPGKHLKVNLSVANVRLFVGNIPKNKSKEEILEEFRKHTDGVVDVIIYNSPDDPKKRNRGFAFLEYDSHKSASMAKHRLGNGYTRVWGCDIIVDWADPQEEPDDETMSKVKVLYVRNLKSDVTEEQLREAFEQHGKVERVKKVKDYGFIHFDDRDHALRAMEALNGTKLGDSEMQISLAKPPTENKQKEKRKQLQKLQQFGPRGFDDSWLPMPYGPMMPPMPRGGRFMRPPGPMRGAGYRALVDYDYYGGAGYRDFSAGGYHEYPEYTSGAGGYEEFGGYYGGAAGGGGFQAERGRGRGGNMAPRGGHPGGYWQQQQPQQQQMWSAPWRGGRGGSTQGPAAGSGPSGGAGAAQWGGAGRR